MDFTESFEKFNQGLDAFLRSSLCSLAARFLPLLLGAGIIVLLLVTQLSFNLVSKALAALSASNSTSTATAPTTTNSNAAIVSNSQGASRNKQAPAPQTSESPEAAGSQPGKLVRMVEPSNGEFAKMAQLADKQKWAGDFINRWNAKYSFPDTTKLIFKDCTGGEVTKWSPEDRKSVICYQFLQEYITAGVDGISLDAPIAQTGLNKYATLTAAQLMAQAFLSQNNLYTEGAKAEQADALSIYWFRQIYGPKESVDVLRGALMGFKQVSETGSSEKNRERSNRMLCLYVGAEPNEADWMKTDGIFTGDAARCYSEYLNLEGSWNEKLTAVG